MKQLTSTLIDAEEAFAELDVTRFSSSRVQIELLLPCLSEQISPSLSASLHRTEGLQDIVNQDEPAAERSFAAARAVEPGFVYPTRIASPGSPVSRTFHALDLAEGMVVVVPQPADGALYFDGLPTLERPVSWPTVVQLVALDGAVLSTQYLHGEEPMFDYTPALPSQHREVRTGALILAGVLLVTSGGAYWGAMSTRKRYDDLSTPYEDLDTLRGRIPLFLGISASYLVAGAGVGAWSLRGRRTDTESESPLAPVLPPSEPGTE